MRAIVKKHKGFGPGSVREYPTLAFAEDMFSLCGITINVVKDISEQKRKHIWYGAGWFWHKSWLLFKGKNTWSKVKRKFIRRKK